METQAELENTIGTKEKEMKRLEPKKVKIVKVSVEPVGKEKNKKVVCQVEHPDADQLIAISSVAYLKDKSVKNTGLWYNLDEDGKLQKGSALVIFLQSTNAEKIIELEGREVETELDGNYLCFKAY